MDTEAQHKIEISKSQTNFFLKVDGVPCNMVFSDFEIDAGRKDGERAIWLKLTGNIDRLKMTALTSDRFPIVASQEPIS